MTKNETSKLLIYLRASYPAHYMKFTDADYQAMIDAWTVTLNDYEFDAVFAGAQAFVATDRAGFPPSVGQILGCMTQATQNPVQQITAAEAWDWVYKALENLDWMHPEREYDKLPRIAQKIIGSPEALKEIAAMPTTDVLIGEKARFIHAYDAYKEKEHEYEKIPERIRDLIEEHTPRYVPVNPDRLSTQQIEDERQKQNRFLEMIEG